MIELHYSKHFIRQRQRYVKGDPRKIRAVVKCLTLLIADPSHPSLNLEKLKNNDAWTVRIDKGNRIFLVWIDSKTALLTDIGPHDTYRQH